MTTEQPNHNCPTEIEPFKLIGENCFADPCYEARFLHNLIPAHCTYLKEQSKFKLEWGGNDEPVLFDSLEQAITYCENYIFIVTQKHVEMQLFFQDIKERVALRRAYVRQFHLLIGLPKRIWNYFFRKANK
jgi:hypothetical protein